ncbi:MAG: hypothetical protein Q8N47_02290 [Bryobacterales bacterium]|nr:hypothetical protein [Bryobacterales bacterium]
MHRLHRFSTILAFTAVLLGMGMIANAQNSLQLSQTTLTFNAPAGSTPIPSQYVFISGPQGATYTATIQYLQTPNWLSIIPLTGPLPTFAEVRANPAGLAQGNYDATITIAAAGVPNSPQIMSVRLIVGAGSVASPLTASPASLSFTYTAGALIPAVQNITVTSSSAQGFSVLPTTQSGGSWLSANPSTATTAATISVAVNPAGLAQGTYNGTVTLTPAGFFGGGALTVPVILTVSSTPELKVGALQPFNFQIGTPTPASQTLAVTSTGATLPFGAAAATQSGGNWLVLSPTGGATPADLTVSVNPSVLSGLAFGSYNGSITISAPGASNPTTTIPVTLNVSTASFVNVTPGSLSFTVQPGGTLPAAQNLNITGTMPNVAFTVAATVTLGANWLSVTPAGAGSTPATVAVSVTANALTLLPGTYNGQVTVNAPNSANVTTVVPVTLTVSNTPSLIVNPASLSFNYQTGRANPQTQTISVWSSGIPAQFNVTAATAKGGQWLQAAPSTATTPWVLSVSANPAGLAADTYTGTITLSPISSGAPPVTINVTLTVSATALLNVSPGAVSFNLPQGTSSSTQNIALTSTGDPLNFTATSPPPSSGGNWLLIGPLSGTTPANLQVYVVPGSLAIGVYSATITVSATGANTQTIPVSLTVTSGASLRAEPGAISFTQVQGGPAPAAQVASLTASGGTPVNFAASATTNSCGNWLTVEPVNGATPAQLRIVPTAVNVTAGTPCVGAITIMAPGTINSPLTIPVTLSVVTPQVLAVNPASLTFSYRVGDVAPAQLSLQATSTPAPVGFVLTSATQSGGDWLTATTNNATTPATITVGVRTQGLTVAGTFTGTITLTSPTASNSPVTVAVTLTVTALPSPQITAVRNAASYAAGPVARGEIIYIEGVNLGPPTLTTLRLNAQGMVDTVLGETRVLFDGIPAPLIYVSQQQTSCVVPYSVAGLTVRMQVEYKGQLSIPIMFEVTDAAPGLFTQNVQGSGQGAILNQDYSLNGPNSPTTRPAALGSVVMIYATGEGQTLPAGVDGRVNNTGTLPRPLLPVSVTIGGSEAEVIYAGAAPNFVSGAMQINVRVPAGITPGNSIPVQVRIGNRLSQSGVTMAVQ